VREYFQREIERTKKATYERKKERLRKEAVAAEGNYPNAEDDEEAQLECAIHLSRAEELYRQGVEQRGGAYEHVRFSYVQLRLTGYRSKPIPYRLNCRLI
jgi:hypothetical protein